MNTNLEKIIDGAEQLELNVAELYKIFNHTFQEDANFWFNIILEEENHAYLIRKIGELEILTSKIIEEMLPAKLHEIRDANEKIISFIDEYKSSPPSREEAFNFALEIEELTVEIYYQRFMKKESVDLLTKAFQKLNADDNDHYARISSYMKEHGIAILKDT